MSVGAHDIGFLKETLNAQQELLQNLYNKLDEERESSSVAADEALSMILRLQGEKAAMEMEASQYKRIAEEKMCHAQETVELFQELTYQKEMLIASLEFQVQAYRFKLQSMGVDLQACEMQYPENMLSRRNGSSGETSGQSCWKRGSSLPPLVLDAMSRRGSPEGSKSSQSSPNAVKDFKEGEASSRREHASEAHNLYWDEMKKLEERVRELANFKNTNEIWTPANARVYSDSSSATGQTSLKRGSSLPSLVLDAICRLGSNEGSKSSQSSPKTAKDFKEGEASVRREYANGGHNSHWDEMRMLEERVSELANFKNTNDILTPTNAKLISGSSSANLPISTLPLSNPSPESSTKPDCAGERTSGDSQCSSSVHDIFEVPQCPDPSPDNSYHDDKYKSLVEDETEAKKVDSVWDDWEKKPLLSPVNVNDSPKPKDINEKIDKKKHPLLPPSKSNDQLKLKDTKSNEKHLLFKHPSCGVADFELQQFKRRLKQLEDERFARRGRDINVESINEELKLLREILGKVNTVQTELTNLKPNKPPPKESVGCIKEVMLCFWP